MLNIETINERRFFIAIEGPPGAGKTTLAQYLSKRIGADLMLEEFDKNPFLDLFFKDPVRFGLQNQLFFLMSRYEQYIKIPELSHTVVSDYIFEKNSLFANINFRDEELYLYEHIHNVVARAINHIKPDIVIFLDADVNILLSRILLRKRDFERNFPVQFISNLKTSYSDFFSNYSDAPVIQIDTTNLDIVNNSSDRERIMLEIITELTKEV